MFRHCVMFRWNDDVSDDAKSAISTALDTLTELDAVQAYNHGPDAGVSEGNWDYVVVADFANIDDYRSYASDADHQAIIADLIKPAISARAAVQYEV